MRTRVEARTTTVQQNTAMVRPPRGLPFSLTLACPPQLSLSLSLSLIDHVRKKKANAADWRNFMRGSHHVPKLTPGRPANKESTQQAFRCPKCGKAYKDRQGLEYHYFKKYPFTVPHTGGRTTSITVPEGEGDEAGKFCLDIDAIRVDQLKAAPSRACPI